MRKHVTLYVHSFCVHVQFAQQGVSPLEGGLNRGLYMEVRGFVHSCMSLGSV